MAPAPDRARRALALGLACYRCALRLYPGAFHRHYAEELAADFEDASEDSLRAHGVRGVIGAWRRAWSDLPLSLCREWLRTPWPIVSVLALGVASVVLYGGVLRAWGPLQRYRERVAAGVPPPPDSPELLFLLLGVVLLPIMCTMIVAALVAVTMRQTEKRRRA